MFKLINIEGQYYQLIRQVRVEAIKDNLSGLKAWRDLLRCDNVLKYRDVYLLVRKVEDAEVVEQSTEEVKNTIQESR